jgi:hypothetical protein
MRPLAACGLLIGAAVCAVPTAVPAIAAPGEWAAIAYDPDGRTGWPNDGFAVWANHVPSQGEAVAQSLGQCASGAGMGGSSAPCELVALIQNGCVALVSLEGVKNPAAGVGPTAQAAVDSTAAGHRVTEVIYNECTY